MEMPKDIRKGVLQAINNIHEKLAPELIGMSVEDQISIDRLLRNVDGTENKSNLGANAILGVSLAVAKAAAFECNLPLYKYVGGSQACRLPVPLMNILNGGAHANNGLDIQEFMIVPAVKNSFRESLRAGADLSHVKKDFGAEKAINSGW